MHGHSELDDPTEPFSRSEIDRKRLQIEAAGEWREDEGGVTPANPAVPEANSPAPRVGVASTEEDGEVSAALTAEPARGPEIVQASDSRAGARGQPDEARGELELTTERWPSEAEVTNPKREAGPEPDPGWFEVNGKRFHVSLEAFDHIGYSGAPSGMIGSADLSLASGAINGEEGAPFRSSPRLTTVQPAASAAAVDTSFPVQAAEDDFDIDDEEIVWRESSRWLGAAVLVLVAVASVALWVWRRPSATVALRGGEERVERWLTGVVPNDEADEGVAPQEAAASAPSNAESLDETDETDDDDDDNDNDDDDNDDDKTVNKAPAKQRSRSTPGDERDGWRTATCRTHRKRAETALQEGNWAELEELARRRRCWSHSRKAKALQLRALFEQERFRKCVEIGAGGHSKEVKKWTSNCERALR